MAVLQTISELLFLFLSIRFARHPRLVWKRYKKDKVFNMKIKANEDTRKEITSYLNSIPCDILHLVADS